MSFLPDLPDSTLDFSRLRMLDRQEEGQVLQSLLDDAHLPPHLSSHASHAARRMINAARTRPLPLFAEFLATWQLSSGEGRTLMALAEALLRIPDPASADRLVNDLLGRADWPASLPHASLKVKAAGWGLAFGSRFIHEEDLPGRGHRLLLKLGDAVFRPALVAGLRLLSGQFVMGESVDAALPRRISGLRYSFDCLGEAAQTAEDVERYTTTYLSAIRTLAGQDDRLPLLARDSVSIKLSALHPRYELRQWQRIRPELLWRLRQLLHAAAECGIPVTLDAEECERLELSLMIFAEALRTPGLQDWHGLGLAVQAYQKRAPAVLDWLQDIAGTLARPIHVRLVKGAYWDSEIKRAQQLGLSGYPVYTRKRHTDVAYLACAHRMLKAPHAFHPQFATHNAHTLAWLETAATATGASFERQRLFGMGENVHDAFAETHERPLRIYAPVGQFNTLLPYLVRRLLENGSSQSFVSQLADAAVTDTTLARDPVGLLDTAGIQSHPRIPLPQDLFPDRPNSPGFSLADVDSLSTLQQNVESLRLFPVTAHSLPLPTASRQAKREQRTCHNPADTTTTLGVAIQALPDDLRQAVDRAADAFPEWSQRTVHERAGMLRHLAALLLESRDTLISLLVHEAGKTTGDALSEWREAFDYCHYYANSAEQLLAPTELPAISGERNRLTLHGRGVFLCISPWNFPLAIFTGQIVAALVTGNTVIAKPAGQTPLVAFHAVSLAHKAGIPESVLQLLIAPGTMIETHVVPNPALAGVAMTGSVAVATTLSRALAAREGARLPLVAETGGLNVMIADSTALPEQLVTDVMTSAFNSAGQRCSALRVLWLQQDIADETLQRLEGTLREWKTGDPGLLSVDMGPVIDEDSAVQLRRQVMTWQSCARWMARGPLGKEGGGHFVAPHAFLLGTEDLPVEEVFGPLLAICTWRQSELPEVVKWSNHLGYGLTLGVHSRLESTMELVRRQARCGNIYENRNQIGAVVGCQPFGGEGLSGTGFKAGGPHYLLRFVTERTVTSNLAATGVNTSLLDLDD